MRKFFVLALVAFLLSPGHVLADVAVRNKTSGTIQVQIGTGSKTEIKIGERALFNSSGEVTVTVYSVFGARKASSTVKNGSKLLVENRGGVWTIKSE